MPPPWRSSMPSDGCTTQAARKSSSAKEAAWALRHSFDDVLSATSDGGKRGTGRDSARKLEDVTGRIREAISIGVPLYNAGDPAACAQVYEVCVRDIEPGERRRRMMTPILQVWERAMQQPVNFDGVPPQDLMRRALPACAPFLSRLPFALHCYLPTVVSVPVAERVLAAGGAQLPALNDGRRAWALR